jgi:predicted ester cyclase
MSHTPAEFVSAYAHMWNDGKFDRIRELAHADLTFRGALGLDTRGFDGFIAYARSIRHSLDDYRCEVLDCVSDANRAFARMQYRGLHVRTFFGHEPTGLPVQWVGAALFQLNEGKLADLWVLGDLHSLENVLEANDRLNGPHL